MSLPWPRDVFEQRSSALPRAQLTINPRPKNRRSTPELLARLRAAGWHGGSGAGDAVVPAPVSARARGVSEAGQPLHESLPSRRLSAALGGWCTALKLSAEGDTLSVSFTGKEQLRAALRSEYQKVEFTLGECGARRSLFLYRLYKYDLEAKVASFPSFHTAGQAAQHHHLLEISDGFYNSRVDLCAMSTRQQREL